MQVLELVRADVYKWHVYVNFKADNAVLKKEEGVAQAIVKENPKKRRRPRKEKIVVKDKSKKKAKTAVVDLGSDEEDVAPTKWKDYEVETLIAIRREMNKEFH